ncbi:Repeat domain-containing protein [Belliella buryatensis]|uniref:Repeat domain-containing protein n=1 Tax=Belliella buryatensis TaxID=1500549 RepID=A0A239CBW4_9BACT|nr:VCBS repeat-containing protein [Belliella buryatensis]SNS16843.1 Repeat domain-containing protein [Belliella buryatensis]
MNTKKVPTLLIFLFLLNSCTLQDDVSNEYLEIVEPKFSGIHFQNTIIENDSLNILSYEYLYNGGGVAAGDLNNNGLPDLIFIGNLVENKVYLNKGDFKFEDITNQSGLQGRRDFATGVSLVDINGDGFLDIYLCYSGPGDEYSRRNELYINNGDLTFTESAKEYGLDAIGTYSTMAAFFDYDGDGDLDMFLLNHGKTFYNPLSQTSKLRAFRHPYYGNQLFRNDNGKFVDVSEEAGIIGNGLNFGLAVLVSDINNDGWPDIFVTNDYNEQDFLYLNNADGTFKEVSKTAMTHQSKFSMGGDLADFNNDGLIDLFTLDMLPEDNRRQKLLKGGDEFDFYQALVDSGYHHQYMRNMLQLNRGLDQNGDLVFQEIGQLSGVSNTDWSWSGLFVDMDNDGLKDLVITNGFLRDFTNKDFLNYTYADAAKEARLKGQEPDLLALVKRIPSTKVGNYLFMNKGDLTFSNESKKFGFDTPRISNGMVYADLDGDGSMDLVINNINEPATVFRNKAKEKTGNNFVMFKLSGVGLNSQAIGTKIKITLSDKSIQVKELYPVRGYQSSVDPVLHFGIGKNKEVIKAEIIWPDRQTTEIFNIHINQTHVLDQSDSDKDFLIESKIQNQDFNFKDYTTSLGVSFYHQENSFTDFKVNPLSFFQHSKVSPAAAVGDVNGDGNDDFFIGGAIGQSGALYLSNTDGRFDEIKHGPWTLDADFKDAGAVFFDANGNGLLDLYVSSGGTEFSLYFPTLQDRLYINKGNGNFEKAENVLPDLTGNNGLVLAHDFDGDGKVDLFIAGRSVPDQYGVSPWSFLLRNESTQNDLIFRDVTPSKLRNAGMITSGEWHDMDGDGRKELVLTGEFMGVQVWKISLDQSREISNDLGLNVKKGFWQSLMISDINQDGKPDLLLGNLGENSQLKADVDKPIKLFIGDFNNSGNILSLMTNNIQGELFPIYSRDIMLSQINNLKKKFVKYVDYAEAGICDILGPQIDHAEFKILESLKSTSLISSVQGYQEIILPLEAQIAPITGGLQIGTDNPEFLLVGNLYPFMVDLGAMNSGTGLLLRQEKGKLSHVPTPICNLDIRGDVRDIKRLKRKDGNEMFLIIQNNGPLKILGIEK